MAPVSPHLIFTQPTFPTSYIHISHPFPHQSVYYKLLESLILTTTPCHKKWQYLGNEKRSTGVKTTVFSVPFQHFSPPYISTHYIYTPYILYPIFFTPYISLTFIFTPYISTPYILHRIFFSFTPYILHLIFLDRIFFTPYISLTLYFHALYSCPNILSGSYSGPYIFHALYSSPYIFPASPKNSL